MDRATDAPSMGEDSIKVGTTGTIGSLMSRELDSLNSSAGAPPPAPRKQQSSPVSVPCGAISRRIVQHRNSQNDSCSNSSSSNNSSVSSSSNGRNHLQSPGAAAQKPRKNARHVPMLESVGSPKEGNLGAKRAEKKDRIRIVEVVDLKCNNPMSSRLKKLGFSKLSETIS